MSILEMLGLLAAAIHLSGYIVYNQQVTNGKSIPPLTSWFIHAILSIINTVSYYGIDTTAWHEVGPPAVGAVMATYTFLHALGSGKFQKPGRRDAVVVVICFLAIGVYPAFQNAAYANFIILVASLVAFWPIARGVFHKPSLESPGAWVIWTISYLLLLLVVLFGNQWEKIVLPVIKVLMHASIIFLSRPSRVAK